MPSRALFFDTNICMRIAEGYMDLPTWNTMGQHIATNYTYVLSPLTLIEILVRVHRGSSSYFSRNRLSLAVLRGMHGGPFLPFPGQFIRRRLFGQRYGRVGFQPSNFGHWLRTASYAQTKEDLFDSLVRLPGDREFTHGLDLEGIDRQAQQGRQQWVGRLEMLRQGQFLTPTRDQWVLGILQALGQPPEPSACARVSTHLESVYQFDSSLWALARNRSYDFEDQASDWIDRQQLFYLADSRMHLVTEDARLVRRIANSVQAGRVLRMETFLKSIRASPVSNHRPILEFSRRGRDRVRSALRLTGTSSKRRRV